MGGLGQDFGVDGVAALEAQPRMRLLAAHGAPMGAEAVRVLCGVLRRPRVAGGLASLGLGCPNPPPAPARQ